MENKKRAKLWEVQFGHGLPERIVVNASSIDGAIQKALLRTKDIAGCRKKHIEKIELLATEG